MTETLSIRIDAKTKKRLEALSKRTERSKSILAAEAIAAYVESEEWQLGELQAGIAELDSGQEVSHEKISKWLNSWGKPGERAALLSIRKYVRLAAREPEVLRTIGEESKRRGTDKLTARRIDQVIQATRARKPKR